MLIWVGEITEIRSPDFQGQHRHIWLDRSYKPFGDEEYRLRLSDPFCRFYLNHVKDNEGHSEYWQSNYNSPAMNSWLGLAFEQVVFSLIPQIKQALGISGVATTEYSWIVESRERGKLQIDMIIDRDDRIVNMCGIKFCQDDFAVDSAYAKYPFFRYSLAVLLRFTAFRGEGKSASGLSLSQVSISAWALAEMA